MKTTTAGLYSLGYKDIRTYLFAAIFIAGNMILPFLCHAVPNGGKILLPIYFFTLIASYKYGFKVGLLTAILSPLLNSVLFGMPAMAVLPEILVKSTFLALTAAFFAHRSGKVSLSAILFAVLSYQIIGTFAEWIIVGNFYLAIQDLRMAVPGLIIQVFGGYGVLKSLRLLK